MPLVVITGGSGYIGSHTVRNFLSHGYSVRLVGRDAASCKRMTTIHKSFDGQIETAIVPDITLPGAFDEAVQGVDGVIHMASPFTYKIEDNERDLLLPAIRGTTGVLESVIKNAGNVKKVVLTSSFAAINDFSKGLRPGHVYDESQWNPITYQQAKEGSGGLAYGASKALAERAAWEVAAGSDFSLATINPVMVYGPPLAGTASLNHLGQSVGEIYVLMNGTLKTAPATPMPVFVDVRDVAEAHRLAFESDKAGRFLLCAGSYTNKGVAQFLKDKIPRLEGRVPVEGGEDGPHYSPDNSRARSLLGLSFRPFEECFLDMANALLELEK